MKKLGICICILGCLLTIVATISCGNLNTADNPNNVGSVAQLNDGIVDYGNGVYYFGMSSAGFGNSLSRFLSNHNCKIEGITGDRGYFVVCR